MITIGTTLGAVRFITATTTIEAETRAAELTAIAVDLTATGAEIVLAAMKGTGPPTRTPSVAAGLKTVPPPRPSPFHGNKKPPPGTREPPRQHVHPPGPS